MIPFISYLQKFLGFTCLLAKMNERSLLETKLTEFPANRKDYNFGMKTLTDFK